MINFGNVAQHSHTYLPGLAWLSLHSLCRALLLFSWKFPGKCKLAPVCFGARKFSFKGKNWIAVMLVSDHDYKNSRIIGEYMLLGFVSSSNSVPPAVLRDVQCSRHSATNFTASNDIILFKYAVQFPWLCRGDF